MRMRVGVGSGRITKKEVRGPIQLLMLMRLLITGGSRTSEPGGQKKFSDIFLRLFTGVSENLFAFFPKKSSFILPKFLTTFFFFSHRPFPGFNTQFFP